MMVVEIKIKNFGLLSDVYDIENKYLFFKCILKLEL